MFKNEKNNNNISTRLHAMWHSLLADGMQIFRQRILDDSAVSVPSVAV